MKGVNFTSSFRGASEASEPGIHNPCSEYGFRACAKRAHPGMTKQEILKP
jgi:hypothetical protein